MSCVTCRVSCASYVVCRVSCVMSYVMCRVSCVMCRVPCHMSCVVCCVSCAVCHMSCVVRRVPCSHDFFEDPQELNCTHILFCRCDTRTRSHITHCPHVLPMNETRARPRSRTHPRPRILLARGARTHTRACMRGGLFLHGGCTLYCKTKHAIFTRKIRTSAMQLLAAAVVPHTCQHTHAHIHTRTHSHMRSAVRV